MCGRMGSRILLMSPCPERLLGRTLWDIRRAFLFALWRRSVGYVIEMELLNKGRRTFVCAKRESMVVLGCPKVCNRDVERMDMFSHTSGSGKGLPLRLYRMYLLGGARLNRPEDGSLYGQLSVKIRREEINPAHLWSCCWHRRNRGFTGHPDVYLCHVWKRRLAQGSNVLSYQYEIKPREQK